MSTTLASSKSSSQSGPASSTGHAKSAVSARQAAISGVMNYSATPPIEFANVPAQEYYSANVFSKQVMKDRLPKSVYKSVMKTIESGEKLDPAVADVVASAMKDWAMEKGATHYAMFSIR